jgi:exonuclease SbcC
MNLDYARQRLATKLADVQEVSQGVLRGVRRNGEKSVAVYLFDMNDKVAENAHRLEAYQDEVVGRSYFDTDADADLRWNHYLYLVNGPQGRLSNHLREATIKLESDQNYARKFVIDEDDFDMVVDRIDSVVTNDSGDVGDVMEVWSAKLIEAGLGCVLEVEKTVADTVRVIATGKSKNTTRQRRVSGADDSARLVSNWITDIDLSGYRKYPLRKKFQQFGRANLIFGTNGVGKTSLMEAIEFLYCGANRRSASVGGLTVTARVGDGSEISTSSSQRLSDFDTRLQNWYGSANKSNVNKLPQAFARFNFLNTDAATELSLAKDGNGVKNNIISLADLISGPGTATLWARIKDVEKELIEHKKQLTLERRLRESEKQAAEKELQALSEQPSQSGAEFEILRRELSQIGWRTVPTEREGVNAALVAELTEVAARLGVVRRLSWADNGVTLPWLNSTEATLTTCKADASKAQQKSEASRRRHVRNKERRTLLETQKRALLAVDFVALDKMLQTKDALTSTELQLKAAAPLMAALGGDVEIELADDLSSATIVSAAASIDTAIRQTHNDLSSRRKELDGAQKKNSLLAEMGGQIRQLAQQMLSHGHTGQLCPVCSTPFEPNDLEARIHRSVVIEGEEQATALRLSVDKLVGEDKRLQQVNSLLINAARYCEVGDIDASSLSVSFVLEKMRDTRARWVAESERRAVLVRELASYEKSGVSEQSIKKLCEEVSDKFSSPTLTVELCHDALALVSAELEESLANVTNDVTEILSDTPIDVAMFARKVGIDSAGVMNLAQLIEEVSLRLEAVSAVKEVSEWAARRLQLRTETDFRALCASLSDAVLSAEMTAKAVERESVSGYKRAQLKATVSQRLEKVTQLSESLDSVTRAITTLADLVKNSSMEQANKKAIIATHGVANEVFARIHAPNEFKITASATTPLNRKEGGAGTSLNEISTGQRAAYALSVFLAMNAQVQDGPKVILLDDPISHIDDLNALSFLDYLRNLILKESRQVFFATADEKVAGLFAHKFAFLGPELRTIELVR